MIELPRGLAREFRSVLRKCVVSGKAREPCPFVVCRGGPNGMTLTCEAGGVIARYEAIGSRADEVIAFPMTLLAELEGKGRVPVRLEKVAPMKGLATWNSGGQEETLLFEAPEVIEPAFPDVKCSDLGANFREALAEATRTVGKDSGRTALRCVLMRGGEGKLVASDGRQLLVQSGFALPWKDDALVPALPLFASREWAGGQVVVGRQAGRVVIRGGPWTVAIKEEEAVHYPDVSRVLASGSAKGSRLALHADDVKELMSSLPSLPGKDEEFSPVVLEFAPTPFIAGGETRLPLRRSRCEGPRLSVRMDRRYLLRALGMGFTGMTAGAGTPVSCRDGARTYLWMPLDTPPNGGPERREEGPVNARDHTTGGVPPTSGTAATDGTPEAHADALAEAEALRLQLQEALARTARLIASLRKQRREGRAVRSAVESLRRLGHLGT